MATNSYATVSDLGAYLGKEPPADSQRMLARAQDLIDIALKSSFYAVDSNGNPTDAAAIAAFNKACCAQVEYWLNNGDELDELNKYSSWSIEGISATRATDVIRRFRLADRAYDALALVVTGLPQSVALLPGKPTI